MKKDIHIFGFLSFFLLGLGCHNTKDPAPLITLSPTQPLPNSKTFHFFYSPQDLVALQKGAQVACIGFDSVIAAHYTAEYEDDKYNKETAQTEYTNFLNKDSDAQSKSAKLIYVGRGVKAFKIKDEWYCPIAARILNETEK